MKRSFIAAMCLWGAVAAGCGSDDSSSATTALANSEAIATLKLIDPPVSSNDAGTDMPGTRFIMVANSQGKSSNISASTVVLQSSHILGSETRATFETLNGMKVGSAYSGTPVFTADGKMAWVLYAGYQGVPNVFFARDINAMLPLFDENSWGVFPPRIATAVTGTEMKTPWWSRGLDSRFSSEYQGPVLNEVIFVEGFTAGAAKSGALASSTTDELSPGSTIAVNLVSGDVVSLYATGTLSYTRDEKRWLAFGHSLDQSGKSNLPVSQAFTNSTIDAGPWGTFKDSYPIGPNIGTLVYDSNKGVVIDTDKVPETTPVTVTITMDGRSMTWTHNVARDNGSWLEYYGLNAAVSGPLYTLNNLTGSYSYSGTVTIGVDGSATEDIAVNNEEQISYGYYSYYARTLEQVLSHLRYNVSEKLSSKGMEGKSFNIVSVDVTITKIIPPLPDVPL